MPWSEVSVRDQRIAFLQATRAPGAVFQAWRKREQDAGSVTALVDRARRPQHSPQRLSSTVVARVVDARRQYLWGGEKLAAVLAAQGVHVSRRTIDRIIDCEGLTHRDAVHHPAPRRFARATPNELWQVDAKGHYPLAEGPCHPLGVLDDCSRYAVGLFALPTLSTATVQAAWQDCFHRVGVPTAMLFDHGTPWWSTAGGSGLTRLTVWLLEQDIQLLCSGRRHPQTQGKVERFHRTVGERLRRTQVPTHLAGFARAFASFRQEYNEVRPHRALQNAVPAARYTPSPRAFQPRPPAWDYPPGMQLQTVRRDGQCALDGQLAYVSIALAGKRVAVEHRPQGNLQVRVPRRGAAALTARH